MAPAAPAAVAPPPPPPAPAPQKLAADAAPAPRPEKPSLLTEPTESRLGANQSLTEVPDAVPTYPNEARSSIPLPYSYKTLRPPAPTRDAAPGGAATGAVAGRAAAPQQLAATRKESAAAESHAVDKTTSPTTAATIAPASGLAPGAAAPASAMIAAAPPLRDPAEWIKAIQKLRFEGKAEQVTKELAEFRRHYPHYVLPDELKNLK